MRDEIERIVEALDRALGDSDLTHIEDDEELLRVAPGQWACAELNKLLQASPPEEQDRKDAERYRYLKNNRRLLNITIERWGPNRSTVNGEKADAIVDWYMENNPLTQPQPQQQPVNETKSQETK